MKYNQFFNNTTARNQLCHFKSIMLIGIALFFSQLSLAQVVITPGTDIYLIDPVYEANALKKYSHHILPDDTEITSIIIKIKEGMEITIQNNNFFHSSREYDKSIDMVTSISIINQILNDNSFDIERAFNSIPSEDLLD
jgi:hypothetical protein